MSRRVLVLGHGGMLGSMAVAYFKAAGDEVLTVNSRFSDEKPESFLREVRSANATLVINAIGAIKQKVSTPVDLLVLNGALPLLVKEAIGDSAVLVHPSTDCVFAGTRGRYEVRERPDATDWYGVSKALGERVGAFPGVLVLRTSIIGPEISEVPHGLMAWLLSHAEGEEITGYVDHYWNGLTTLEWCRYADERTSTSFGPRSPGEITQPCANGRYSKCDVLEKVIAAFARKIHVKHTKTANLVDRTLQPTTLRKPLEAQLHELVQWMTTEDPTIPY